MSGPKLFLLTCLTPCLAVAAWAQAPSKTPSNNKPKQDDFSQEAVVVEKIATSVRFENDGTSVHDQELRARVQTDAGAQQLGLMTFKYMKDVEKLDIVSLVVHKPDGTTVATPPDAVQDMAAEISNDAPFFTDMREKHVPVKSLAAGDVLEYHIRETMTKSLVPNQFWYVHDFDDLGVVLSEELRVDVPKDRALIVKSDVVKPTITEQGDRKIYTWTTSHPRKKDEQPPILPGRLPAPDVEITTFRSWNELADWTNGLYKDRLNVTPELAAKAAELTKNAKTEEEKIRALYDYVSLHYRYIGLALGPARWQPHSAAEVFSDGYGDCKDKHALLATLLKAEGIQAYPALLNSARLVDTEVPSPAQFDHVMTYVPSAKGPVWLDTTVEVAPYGWILFMMRDKTAIVIYPDHASIEKLPSKGFEDAEEFHADATLSDDGTITAKIDRVMHGDSDVLVRSVYRKVGPAQTREVTQRISYGTGFAGSVDDVTISPVEDTSIPFEIKYQYTRKDYSEWENRRLTAFMPPLGLPGPSQEPNKANDPVILGEPIEYEYDSNLKVPAGYMMVVPQNVDLMRDYAEYHSKYDFKGDVLTVKRTLRVKTSEVKPAQFASYKSFIKAVSDDADQYIFATNGKATTFAQKPAAPLLDDEPFASDKGTPEDAKKLVEQARSLLGGRDFGGAEKLLQRAVNFDTNVPDGWAMLGFAQIQSGKSELGLASLRKQIEIDPKNEKAYMILGMTLGRLNRLDQAIPVWHKLLELDPKDRQAMLMVASAEMSLKRYSDAEADLKKAQMELPEDAAIMGSLGQVYLKSGKNNEAIENFRKALEKDPSPVALNNVAYELADANLDLDESLKWSQQAVQAEEARGQDTDLANLRNDDFRHPLTLATYWDTLGWVYFRKNDLVNAEKYLRAAWGLEQSVMVGYHLGQVYEGEKNVRAASRMYAMALAADGGGEVKPDIRKRLEKLVSVKARVNILTMQGLTDLNNERTIKVPWRTHEKFSSDFFILIGSDSKVEKMQFSGQKATDVLEQYVNKLGARQPFPEMSGTKIVRKGVVYCSGGPTCDIALVPTSSAMN